jgi:hypothetical protein
VHIVPFFKFILQSSESYPLIVLMVNINLIIPPVIILFVTWIGNIQVTNSQCLQQSEPLALTICTNCESCSAAIMDENNQIETFITSISSGCNGNVSLTISNVTQEFTNVNLQNQTINGTNFLSTFGYNCVGNGGTNSEHLIYTVDIMNQQVLITENQQSLCFVVQQFSYFTSQIGYSIGFFLTDNVVVCLLTSSPYEYSTMSGVNCQLLNSPSFYVTSCVTPTAGFAFGNPTFAFTIGSVSDNCFYGNDCQRNITGLNSSYPYLLFDGINWVLNSTIRSPGLFFFNGFNYLPIKQYCLNITYNERFYKIISVVQSQMINIYYISLTNNSDYSIFNSTYTSFGIGTNINNQISTVNLLNPSFNIGSCSDDSLDYTLKTLWNISLSDDNTNATNKNPTAHYNETGNITGVPEPTEPHANDALRIRVSNFTNLLLLIFVPFFLSLVMIKDVLMT